MRKIPSLAWTGMLLLAVGACSQSGGDQNKAAGAMVTNDLAAFQAGAGPDGRLSIEEYRAIQSGMVRALDSDADGALSTAELAAMPERRRGGWTMYDINHDGTMSAAELEGKVAPSFTMRDRNYDRAITRDEVPDGTPAGGYLF